MTATKKRTTGLAAALVLASMLIPGSASAAVEITADSVVVYGHTRPGNPGADDPVFGSGSIFPISRPLGRGEEGHLYFEGNATPGSLVDVTVTDDFGNTISSTVQTGSVDADPDLNGYGPGDFGVGVPTANGPGRSADSDLNSIDVTPLGVHTAETDPAINPDGPNSDNPAHWGPSPLSITFVARGKGADGVFGSEDDELSEPVVRQITKYAAWPGDVTPPRLAGLHFPPEHWCHTSGTGMQEPFDGNHLGGESDGKCSDLAQAPLGAVPDVTWVGCLRETSNPHHIIDPTLPGSPFRGFYCRTSPGHSIPRGENSVQGRAVDDFEPRQTEQDGTDTYGAGSEIAEVKIEVFHGEDPYLGPFVVGHRFGARMGFTLPLQINDFEPSWPAGTTYTIVVTATDAWGNSASATSYEINVYPY